jgi:hypothetical protein
MTFYGQLDSISDDVTVADVGLIHVFSASTTSRLEPPCIELTRTRRSREVARARARCVEQLATRSKE